MRKQSFYAWQPSTWPEPPESFNEEFRATLGTIFNESLLAEIGNVIGNPPNVIHKGHVVALSILCAIDAIAAYAYNSSTVGDRYRTYVQSFFPSEYQPFAERIYKLYRNSIAHNWNLFEATMWADNRTISEAKGTINLGLLNLFDALRSSVNAFIEKLSADSTLQAAALHRYRELKRTARP
ncbi:MAG: hypothetical protein HZA17_08685 [Nitrospirae bacterium]|nr:hypothetical protein [Nitrospirota bacterium]